MPDGLLLKQVQDDLSDIINYATKLAAMSDDERSSCYITKEDEHELRNLAIQLANIENRIIDREEEDKP